MVILISHLPIFLPTWMTSNMSSSCHNLRRRDYHFLSLIEFPVPLAWLCLFANHSWPSCLFDSGMMSRSISRPWSPDHPWARKYIKQLSGRCCALRRNRLPRARRPSLDPLVIPRIYGTLVISQRGNGKTGQSLAAVPHQRNMDQHCSARVSVCSYMQNNAPA